MIRVSASSVAQVGRWGAVALVAAGVGACDPVPYQPPSAVTLQCPFGEPTTNAALVFSAFTVNGITLAPFFDPAATYNQTTVSSTPTTTSDTAGEPVSTSKTVADAAACYDAENHAASFLFEVSDAAFGRLDLHSSGGTLGNLELGVDNPVSVDLFGANPAGVFDGTDFIDGSYYVGGLDPLSIDFLGNAQDEGRQLSIAVSAQVRP